MKETIKKVVSKAVDVIMLPHTLLLQALIFIMTASPAFCDNTDIFVGSDKGIKVQIGANSTLMTDLDYGIVAGGLGLLALTPMNFKQTLSTTVAVLIIKHAVVAVFLS